MATISPDFFKYEELNYNSESNRKAWLKIQIAYADQAILQYQTELLGIQQDLGNLGVSAANTGIVAAVGVGIAKIPAGYTQIIGGVVILAGSIFSALAKKAKTKQATAMIEVAQRKVQEVEEIGRYRSKYVQEIFLLNLIPFLLTAILIYIILKDVQPRKR